MAYSIAICRFAKWYRRSIHRGTKTSNISFETSDCNIALEGTQRDQKNVKAVGKGYCDRKKGIYAFEECLRPRKGSDNLKKGISCFGRSPLHCKMVLKG